MRSIERFTNNDVKIQYIETTNFNQKLLPLVYIPGAMGNAEQFIEEMGSLFPRQCISISLRGRGKSEAPKSGYTFEEHIMDITSVIKERNINAYCLMAYSMGVAYAIKYAAMNPNEIKGLILCDYPAKYPLIQETWIEAVGKFVEEGKDHVIRGIQKDSQDIVLWEELKEIGCPVLVLKGGTEGSLLNTDDVEKYKSHLKNVEVIEFSESGHELWNPDYNKFINTITNYLEKIDN
ncbi:alpha/beta hydrolase [Lysinibacillus sp. fls2-241-R2A-57]|uniref:alpha/beta fold hydrolase n=1 Tax=Lysinibacillus sp. fls2-241-R2A-57 TaxID=3040292 RepID=UPI002553C04D|nr:alpha/beta hydrolase [Lysinibacillus sp. fls2-241-R2A-57]